jgi:hypothetical protein
MGVSWPVGKALWSTTSAFSTYLRYGMSFKVRVIMDEKSMKNPLENLFLKFLKILK